MQENLIFVKINKKAHIYACLYVDKLKNIQQEVIWELILLIYGGILGHFSVLLGAWLILQIMLNKNVLF